MDIGCIRISAWQRYYSERRLLANIEAESVNWHKKELIVILMCMSSLTNHHHLHHFYLNSVLGFSVNGVS
jgi:hypothetical protein